MTPTVEREPVETALRALLEQQGPTLIDAPALVRSLLLQRCPEAAHDVACIVDALDAGVPRALLDARGRGDQRTILRTLAGTLRRRCGMNRYAAAWAVDAWAGALWSNRQDDDAPATSTASDVAPLTASSPVAAATTGTPAPAGPMRLAAPDVRPSAPRRRVRRRLWFPAAVTIVSACAIVLLTIALVRALDRAARADARRAPPPSRVLTDDPPATAPSIATRVPSARFAE